MIANLAVRAVALVATTAALAGCAGSPQEASGPTLSAQDVADIELAVEGQAIEPGEGRDRLVAPVSDYADSYGSESVAPSECEMWHDAQRLRSGADACSSDEILYVGSASVPGRTSSDSAAIRAAARVFATPVDADEFFDALADAARACPTGYTHDQTTSSYPDGAPVRLSVSTGAISASEHGSDPDARVLVVEASEVERWSGDYGEVLDETSMYVQYGNVVFFLRNASDGARNEPLSGESWDALEADLVAELGRLAGAAE